MAPGDVVANLTKNNSKKCARFDGVDDRVTIPVDLNGRKAISIMGWFRAPAGRGLIDWRSGAVSIILRKSDGRHLMYMTTENGTVEEEGVIAGFDKNKWYHLAICWDGSVVSYYLNGSLISTDNLTGSIAYTSWGSNLYCWVGRERGGSSVYYKGQTADIKIFNRGLNQTEITKIVNNQLVKKGLIHQYNFLDNDYTDSVGSADGTNSGSYISIVDDAIAPILTAATISGAEVFGLWDGILGNVGTVVVEG